MQTTELWEHETPKNTIEQLALAACKYQVRPRKHAHRSLRAHVSGVRHPMTPHGVSDTAER